MSLRTPPPTGQHTGDAVVADDGEVIAAEAEPRGWDDIAEWTGGIALDQIDSLRSARELEPAYPLLHALVGRSLRDFLVRAAALESLLASDLPRFGKADLDQALWWLDEQARDSTCKALRQTRSANESGPELPVASRRVWTSASTISRPAAITAASSAPSTSARTARATATGATCLLMRVRTERQTSRSARPARSRWTTSRG